MRDDPLRSITGREPPKEAWSLPPVDPADGPCLNLGCGRDPLEGWHNVDLVDGPGVDEVVDLSEVPWPWLDDRASVILAENILEHLPTPDVAVKEAHRVLRPGGLLLIEVPHRDGRHACQIDHRSFWDEHTLDIYTGRGRGMKGLDAGRLFDLEALEVLHAHPFAWHQRRYLGTELIGFGARKLRFVLRKRGPYATVAPGPAEEARDDGAELADGGSPRPRGSHREQG